MGVDKGPQGFSVPLNEMVESLCDFYGDVDGYSHLYVVAHELCRAAESLWEKARFIEDSESAVSNLFDLGNDWVTTLSLP